MAKAVVSDIWEVAVGLLSAVLLLGVASLFIGASVALAHTPSPEELALEVAMLEESIQTTRALALVGIALGVLGLAAGGVSVVRGLRQR